MKEKERSYLTISKNIRQVTRLFAFRKHSPQKGCTFVENINGNVYLPQYPSGHF